MHAAKRESLLVLVLREEVCEPALAAHLPVEVGRHHDTRTARLGRALTPQPGELARLVNLVVLKHSEFDLKKTSSANGMEKSAEDVVRTRIGHTVLALRGTRTHEVHGGGRAGGA